jgi:hypothetical protein
VTQQLSEVTACQCCGVEFATTSPQRKFCTRRCKDAASRGVPGRGPQLDAVPLRDYLRTLEYADALSLATKAGVPEAVMRRIRSGQHQTVTVDTADRLLLHTNVHISVLYPFKETAA